MDTKKKRTPCRDALHLTADTSPGPGGGSVSNNALTGSSSALSASDNPSVTRDVHTPQPEWMRELLTVKQQLDDKAADYTNAWNAGYDAALRHVISTYKAQLADIAKREREEIETFWAAAHKQGPATVELYRECYPHMTAA